jgi:hypothetical protein
MHLLHARTLKLEYFVGDRIPPYAILSRTLAEEEVSMQDLLHDPEASRKKGYAKIAATCKQALRDDLEFCWVDTCCIDEPSSAELSEAINSMFKWYERSEVCYAYLADFQKAVGYFAVAQWKQLDGPALARFLESRWFTRGWTLQELIAPRALRFYDATWAYVGTRNGPLASPISEKTGVDIMALDGTPLDMALDSRGRAFAIGRRFIASASPRRYPGRLTERQPERKTGHIAFLDCSACICLYCTAREVMLSFACKRS